MKKIFITSSILFFLFFVRNGLAEESQISRETQIEGIRQGVINIINNDNLKCDCGACLYKDTEFDKVTGNVFFHLADAGCMSENEPFIWVKVGIQEKNGDFAFYILDIQKINLDMSEYWSNLQGKINKINGDFSVENHAIMEYSEERFEYLLKRLYDRLK